MTINNEKIEKQKLEDNRISFDRITSMLSQPIEDISYSRKADIVQKIAGIQLVLVIFLIFAAGFTKSSNLEKVSRHTHETVQLSESIIEPSNNNHNGSSNSVVIRAAANVSTIDLRHDAGVPVDIISPPPCDDISSTMHNQ